MRYLKKLPQSKWEVTPPGSQPGKPDITGCWGGVYVAIEVKNETGALTKLQKFELNGWKKAVAITIVARSVQDVKDILKSSIFPY